MRGRYDVGCVLDAPRVVSVRPLPIPDRLAQACESTADTLAISMPCTAVARETLHRCRSTGTLKQQAAFALLHRGFRHRILRRASVVPVGIVDDGRKGVGRRIDLYLYCAIRLN